MATSDYRYSYSGADCRASAYFPGRADKIAYLESLHTISWSVHEAKGQARALGYRGIRGLSRSIRTIGGTLIMWVIEDNPLAPVMDMMADIYLDPALRFQGWSLDWQTVGVGSGVDSTVFNRRLATTLPPFNVLVQMVSEGAQWKRRPDTASSFDIPGAAYLLEDVEFTSEGHVTSVSDAATEMTYSFLARDVKTLSIQQFEKFINMEQPVDDTTRKDYQLYEVLRREKQAAAEQYKAQMNEYGIANKRTVGSFRE